MKDSKNNNSHKLIESVLDDNFDSDMDDGKDNADSIEDLESLYNTSFSGFPEATQDEPLSRYPIEAALAVAESIAPSPAKHDAVDDQSIDGNASLMQMIDRVEQHIDSGLKQLNTDEGGAYEDLDVLEIQTELGRPDIEIDTTKLLRVTDEEKAVANIEKTDGPQQPEKSILPGKEIRASLDIDSIGLKLGLETKWRGALADDPVWRLLTLAFTDKRSGAITISRGDVERKLFLDNGDVIAAVSSARNDRLVELLFREGRFGTEEYRSASMIVGARQLRAGTILTERGLIASRELFPLVRHRYESIILDSFSWREGTWRYDPKVEIKERILLDIRTPELIIEGMRLKANPEDIDALAPNKSKPVAMKSSVCNIEEVGLVPEEMEIFKALDGTTDIETLAERFDIDLMELKRMIAGLSALGLAQTIAGRPRIIASEIEEPLNCKSAQSVDEEVRIQIKNKLDLIQKGSYFDILEIKSTATGQDIRKAYKRLKSDFAPERFAMPALADLEPECEKISAILDEAYEILRDPARRDAYRKGAMD